MKKLFILPIAAAAVAFAGCSNENDGASQPVGTDAIAFRSVIQKSRATETDVNNIRDFKVFGVWGTNTDFMKGVNVVRNVAAWEYAPTSYWPETGDVDFYAFSPAGSLSVQSTTFDIDIAPTTPTPIITYSVPTGANLQEDFLVAVTPNQTSADSPVLIDFKHALSQAVFEARSTLKDVLFNVEAIEITNLLQQADLYLSTAPLEWSNPASVKQDYSAALQTIPVTYHAANYTRLSGPNDGLMLLPQEGLTGLGTDTTPADGVPDDAADTGNYLVVTYGVNLASSGVAIVPAGKKVYIPIASAPTLASGFEPGKKYLFQLDMSTGLKPITFTVHDVDDWEPETVPAQ
jgi:hypothetical protein